MYEEGGNEKKGKKKRRKKREKEKEEGEKEGEKVYVAWLLTKGAGDAF